MTASPLQRLFSTIWLNRDPAERLVLMASWYGAYFDASGHPDDSESLFVSGFVSTGEKWLKFEQEWNSLLSGYGIVAPFHMKEFAPGVGQYASWKDDKHRRAELLEKAI